MDTLLLAVVDDLLLWERGVVLNLVDCRYHGSLRKQLLQITHAVVRDTDGLDLICRKELLHVLPCFNVGVRVNDVSGAILMLREERVVS